MLNVATQRVVALVDMDCFYCQVEARLNPALKGKPMAVVQYNQWKGGGIIAVNYEARDRGVTRYMRGDEAKEICPEITLVSVPTVRGKADLSNYRDAGDEVAGVISEFSDCVQRASIDEAYLDLTKAVRGHMESHKGGLNAADFPNTFVVGYCDLKNKNEEDRLRGLTEWLDVVEREGTRESADYQLAIGAIIVEKMRDEILRRTGFHCSAGIAHNKMLAKLSAGLHKPRRQTVLPQDAVPELYEGLPVCRVRNLGGKLGRQVSEKLSISYMSDLFKFSLEDLREKFDEKTSNWLHNIARGIDLEPVVSRLRPESIGCCKRFAGKGALGRRSGVEHWVRELATEVAERLVRDLERNRRRANLLTVSFCQETSTSRCGALQSYEAGKIASEALGLLRKSNSAPDDEDAWIPPIKFLGLSASKFTEEIPSVEKYFKYSKDTDEPSKKAVDLTSGTETQSTSTRALKTPEAAIDEKGGREGEKMSESSGGERSDKAESFFLKYLSRRKLGGVGKEGGERASGQEERRGQEGVEGGVEEEEEGEAWISLTEVFPDITEAESEVVESLPAALQEKLRERLRSINGGEGKGGSRREGWQSKPEKEVCKQCSKRILKSEALIHSDYHAAVRLYAELNQPGGGTGKEEKKEKKERKERRKKKKEEGEKNGESLSKRKKNEAEAPSKKMKSLTAFFAPLTKE